jgi:hypothetical protein
MKHSVSIGLSLLLATLPGCKSSGKRPQPPSVQQSQPIASTNAAENDCKESTDLYTKAGGLSYNGYDVVRLKRKVKREDMDRTIEISYAALKKGGRAIATFDGFYYDLGNTTEFGLFPLLGGEQNQLLVSQIVLKGGRHWVIDLSSGFRILFDSSEYDLLGNEQFCFKDIDKDGIYEISLAMTQFWVFGDMAMSESPRPEIIFKYNPAARKYLPANLIYQDYLLKGIDEEIRKLDPADEEPYLANRLRILLGYVYAGKEKQGWKCFDAEYTRPDAVAMKAKIKAVLNKEPVYKFLYTKRAT